MEAPFTMEEILMLKALGVRLIEFLWSLFHPIGFLLFRVQHHYRYKNDRNLIEKSHISNTRCAIHHFDSDNQRRIFITFVMIVGVSILNIVSLVVVCLFHANSFAIEIFLHLGVFPFAVASYLFLEFCCTSGHSKNDGILFERLVGSTQFFRLSCGLYALWLCGRMVFGCNHSLEFIMLGQWVIITICFCGSIMLVFLCDKNPSRCKRSLPRNTRLNGNIFMRSSIPGAFGDMNCEETSLSHFLDVFDDHMNNCGQFSEISCVPSPPLLEIFKNMIRFKNFRVSYGPGVDLRSSLRKFSEEEKVIWMHEMELIVLSLVELRLCERDKQPFGLERDIYYSMWNGSEHIPPRISPKGHPYVPTRGVNNATSGNKRLMGIFHDLKFISSEVLKTNDCFYLIGFDGGEMMNFIERIVHLLLRDVLCFAYLISSENHTQSDLEEIYSMLKDRATSEDVDPLSKHTDGLEVHCDGMYMNSIMRYITQELQQKEDFLDLLGKIFDESHMKKINDDEAFRCVMLNGISKFFRPQKKRKSAAGYKY